MPTIRDVAKRAGVAPITVSRAINNSGYVSQEVRQRIEQAIAELHYIPNALGPSLRSKKTHILALILDDFTNPFWTTVARGVEDAANKSGYYVVMCNTDESQTKQDEYITVMLQKQVDGFLLVPVQSKPDAIYKIQRQSVPIVVLDRRVPGNPVDIVRCDSEEGAYQLICHLIKQGHTKISMINGAKEVSTAWDRAAGYRRAMQEAGIPVDDDRIYWGNFRQRTGYELTKLALQARPRPTALFAANNFIAIGAVRAIREAGLSIPNDIALAAFDDLPDSLLLDSFLTVASQSAYEMGYQATQLLLEYILGPAPDHFREILLPAEIIVRRSTLTDKAADKVATE